MAHPAVSTVRPEYTDVQPKWTRCRDAFAGSDAIKEAGETYLPRLKKQDDADYNAYKNRALWYGATERTVQGLSGAIFRKESTVTLPDDVEEHTKDITLTGTPLHAFERQVIQEVLVVGRFGVLVDMGKDLDQVARPYWIPYSAEQIINWRTSRVNGSTVLSLVVLAELKETVNPEDIFETVYEQRYRVLSLDDAGKYHVEVWKETEIEKDGKKETTFTLEEATDPVIKGDRMNFIPFMFFGPNSTSPDIVKPPLLNLVDINISHYQSSADLEHGRHFTGLPTPWAAGFEAEGELAIGSQVAWVTSTVGAEVGMLEFTGQGLGALENALLDKEKKMAAMGARLLEEQPRHVEAAETVRLRQSGQNSVMQDMADTISLGLTQLMVWHVQWLGGTTDKVGIQINRDFFDVEMSPTMLEALMLAWQSEFISWETAYHNLQKNELARPGVDAEAERKLIEDHAVKVARITDGLDPDDNDTGGDQDQA